VRSKISIKTSSSIISREQQQHTKAEKEFVRCINGGRTTKKRHV